MLNFKKKRLNKMTQVILFTQDIPDLELIKSSLAVPYSTVDAADATDALPLIQ